ncbi:Hypothetical protein Cp1002B_0029 [Corynebacterium pseudotuberculosis]|nr:Hypothetical protein CpPAT10_0023b [Corynebacterium pseudotuberculosis PAT10]AFF21192.1 Hypothetical protein CpP54B96_0026 [Corynebacterium pseudotuberculosis P54B96]AFH50935.1 Hypothetical protein Cp267_0026 [Corynebacterium pseudotuberculosis 267]AJC12764.1 Hypothetical protein CpVD57_0025 [Corynebacterium pseudotuberculosis]AKJ54689.1 Hypothetical protein Cp12C_0028 [Corynebacterium pseudotuberculosis]
MSGFVVQAVSFGLLAFGESAVVAGIVEGDGAV